VRTLRKVTPADGPALLEMYSRCSAGSRYSRWHGHTTSFPRAYLAAVLQDADQLAVVVLEDDDIIALASAPREPESDDPDAREIAILIQDDRQRQGLGLLLLNELVIRSREVGTTRLRAEMLSSDAGLIRLLRRYGPTSSRPSYGLVVATVDLPPCG
jgi:hypothetical protein